MPCPDWLNFENIGLTAALLSISGGIILHYAKLLMDKNQKTADIIVFLAVIVVIIIGIKKIIVCRARSAGADRH